MVNDWYDEVEEAALSPMQVLGRDGQHEQLELLNSSARGVFGFNSRDKRSRPFNLLRSQVLSIMKEHDWTIIGVTSATPRVGKTFIASNLAASLSRVPNMHTLLFDLDLRRGSVAETFGIEETLGIHSFLAGEIDSLDAAAHDVVRTGLTIFPSFPSSASSAELLAGSRLKTLISATRGLRSNIVSICDMPPAFANDDAAIIAREIDAYLLVVEEGRTTASQVRDAIEVLKPGVCLGTVLNRYQSTLGSDDYGFGSGSSREYDAYYT